MENNGRSYKDLSLIDWLCYIMSDYFSPTNTRREVETGLGHEMTMQGVARSLFGIVFEKFNQCSEKERRSIARSDSEFIYMLKILVIQKMLLVGKNENITGGLEQEVYQDIWIPTPVSDIPKVPRGNELLWTPEGDPIMERTVQEKKRDTRMTHVLHEVWDNVHELYPDEYEKTWPVFMRAIEKGQLVINTSHEDASDILLHETGQEFYSVAVPWITNMVINEIMKVCSIGRKRQREMYTRVANATWNKLVDR